MKKQQQTQKQAQILHGRSKSDNKNRRRQRNANGERNKTVCGGNLSTIMLHVTIATICNIMRTAEAFRIVSVSTQWRLTQMDPTRIRTSSSYDPSSSSLYVLSSPRRRTSSSNNNIDLPSPIELNPSLMINVQEINGNDSFFKTLESTSTSTSTSTPRQEPLPTLSSTSTAGSVSTLQAPPPTEEMDEIEEPSPHDVALGAASKSSLFRRQHSSAMEQDENNHHHYPSFKVSTAASAILSNPKNAEVSRTRGRKRKRTSSHTPTITEVTTVDELDRYWPRCLEKDEEVGKDEDCPISQDDAFDPSRPIDYNQLLRGISVKGDTQIIGAKDRPDFVHPVVKLMHERKREQDPSRHEESRGEALGSKPKKEKIALVVEGGGMRGCVSAGMVCAIHVLGLSDTIDVVYGSSAGAVIAAYFVSKQLPYFGTEVYYDALTTMEDPTRTKSTPEPNDSNQQQQQQQANHILDRYSNDYFIDVKRMTRSMGLGLCDPRLLKDVWTRRIHGKPMMNLHYMFDKIMVQKKAIDYDTFIQRQSVQPLKVVATGLSSEKPVVLSHEGGHFDTMEDLCSSLHASCLLPGIAGPVMNVLKRIRRSQQAATMPTQKPNFVLRKVFREKRYNDEDYEPLGDAMLSAPIPYDIAHEEGATHVLVIRSSPDGTNLLAVPTVMAWIGSKIFKRYFLKKNHLPGMYKRSQTEQRHQRLYAKIILELNQRANAPPPTDSNEDQTMTIALEPGSEEVNHLETTREGIFKGVRQGFARAYDALVEDPALRGRGKEMALVYFPDEILEYDPNDSRLSSTSSQTDHVSEFRSAFEEYLTSTGVVPKTWREDDSIQRHAMP